MVGRSRFTPSKVLSLTRMSEVAVLASWRYFMSRLRSISNWLHFSSMVRISLARDVTERRTRPIWASMPPMKVATLARGPVTLVMLVPLDLPSSSRSFSWLLWASHWTCSSSASLSKLASSWPPVSKKKKKKRFTLHSLICALIHFHFRSFLWLMLNYRPNFWVSNCCRMWLSWSLAAFDQQESAFHRFKNCFLASRRRLRS